MSSTTSSDELTDRSAPSEGFSPSILNPSDLAGKAVLITGASSGIGQATALALASSGMLVTCVDIAPPEQTVEAIRAAGGTARGAVVNIADDEAVRETLERAAATYGRLDAVVNCAGIGDFTTLEQTTPEHWERQLAINLTGPFYLIRHAIPLMKAQGSGSIVLFGSIAGKTGGLKNGPAYAAAKGGVHSLVKWAAKANAPAGIRVNSIAPGPVDTPFTQGQGFDPKSVPLGRMGEAADFAEAVSYLVSDASSWITGQILNINGGLLME